VQILAAMRKLSGALGSVRRPEPVQVARPDRRPTARTFVENPSIT
jgi:hypothetical protein